jgi:hypothetical protein
MRIALALTATLATLASCATGPATPARVTLEADLLTVTMSDATTCRGPAPATGADTGWSGRLSGCPSSYAYTVEIDPGTNPVRFLLTEVFGEGIVSPLATVTITDATGRTRSFQSPDGADD